MGFNIANIGRVTEQLNIADTVRHLSVSKYVDYEHNASQSLIYANTLYS
jgi:hypothetical protein